MRHTNTFNTFITNTSVITYMIPYKISQLPQQLVIVNIILFYFKTNLNESTLINRKIHCLSTYGLNHFCI